MSRFVRTLWRRITRCGRRDQPYAELESDIENGGEEAKKKVGTLTILKRLFETIWGGMLLFILLYTSS